MADTVLLDERLDHSVKFFLTDNERRVKHNWGSLNNHRAVSVTQHEYDEFELMSNSL